ncbi:MAG TPA: hypothetical protein VGA45_07150, partial [Actinomycetota bacterium]
ERLHTLVVAIGLSTAGSVVFMWLIVYKSIALLSLIEALLVAWGVAMAVAVVFPSRRRGFYDASPVRWTVGGVPVMSIAGGVAALFFVYVGYLLWNDPIAAGPMFTLHHLSREFWIVLGIVLFGVVWFAGTKLYRRRQGIDIDLAFRQIPIE